VLLEVNTPPPKGGGFRLRLKAGLVRLRRTWRQLTRRGVVLRFRCCLVLDVVDSHPIGRCSFGCCIAVDTDKLTGSAAIPSA